MVAPYGTHTHTHTEEEKERGENIFHIMRTRRKSPIQQKKTTPNRSTGGIAQANRSADSNGEPMFPST